MMTGWNNYGNSTHHATQNQTNQRVGKELDFKIDSHVQNHVHIQKHLNSSCTLFYELVKIKFIFYTTTIKVTILQDLLN